MLTLSQKHFSNSLDIFSVLHIIYFCEFANDLQMHSNCICTFMILYNRREDIFMLLEVIKDTVFDSLRLLPFLFLTYLLMEFLEHRAGEAGRARIGAANASGPVWGALFGIIPQCGFSAAASGLYCGHIITFGTLMAVFLSTSDEMLPILISSAVGITRIVRILAVKVIIAMISGLLIDLLIRDQQKNADHHEHHSHTGEPDCEEHLLISALRHTAEVFFYIFVISFLLNLLIALIGEQTLAGIFTGLPVVGEFAAALVGLIPNCASSVILTELYLSGILSAGAMMSGLLVNAGVGLLVLFRLDHDKKDIFRIISILYGLGVFWGLVIEASGVLF